MNHNFKVSSLTAALALGLGLAASSVPFSASAQSGMAGGTAASTLSASDAEFVNKAAVGGMTEVQLGKVALGKTGNAKVRAFANTMVTDHQQANDKLAALGASHGWSVPTSVDASAQSTIDTLTAESGTAFDQAYAAQMKKDHATTVAMFKHEAADGGSSELKSFASSTLPTLEHHMKMANKLNATLAAPMQGNQ